MRDLKQAEWLMDVAGSPGDAPKMIAFGELVQRGLARIEDLAELRAAGLQFFELEGAPETAPRVWVDARAFVLAAAVVAKQRDAAGDPGRVH